MTRTLIALLAAATIASAWQPIQVNDGATVYHSGPYYWAFRGHSPMAATLNPIPRESKIVFHCTAPADPAAIRAVLIPAMALQEFIAPCSGQDTVSFRIELAWAYDPDSMHVTEDFSSQAWARSPVLHIPFGGDVTRSFYSALDPPQGNSWDSLAIFLREALLPGDAFLVRIVPWNGSGVAYFYSLTPFNPLYSNDLSQETEGIDDGPPGVDYLPPAALPQYDGLVLRGKWRRDFGRDLKLTIFGYDDVGTQTYVRRVSIPFDEEATGGVFNLSVDADTLESVHALQMNDSTIWPCHSRADSITLLRRTNP